MKHFLLVYMVNCSKCHVMCIVRKVMYRKTLVLTGSCCFLAVKVTKVEYKTVKRKPKDDYSFSYGKSGTLTSKEREVELNEEFVQVKVHTEDGAVQKDFHLEVQPKKRVLANAKSNSRTKPGIPLNIFMIGFDSTSRSMFTRKMPKVHRYLVDDPSSFILKGYSVVGDGTPPAQIAILVGKAPEELPEARPSA